METVFSVITFVGGVIVLGVLAVILYPIVDLIFEEFRPEEPQTKPFFKKLLAVFWTALSSIIAWSLILLGASENAADIFGLP